MKPVSDAVNPAGAHVNDARFEQRLIAVTIAAVLLYGAWAVGSDLEAVQGTLRSFGWHTFAWAIGLSIGNYVLRFVRWSIYLDAFSLRIPLGRSVHAFLAGFAMSISPGKLGEVLKGVLLRRTDGVPLTSSAAIVLVERLTDVLGLLVVAGGAAWVSGAASSASTVVALSARALIAAGVASLWGTMVLGSRRLMEGVMGLAPSTGRAPQLVTRVREAWGDASVLLRPRPLVSGVGLAAIGWGAEAWALHLLIGGLPGSRPDAAEAMFVYATTTLAGAFSFLPGGLGAAELTMGALLPAMGLVSDGASAFAITALIRLATLWFGVAIGVLALASWRRVHAVAGVALLWMACAGGAVSSVDASVPSRRIMRNGEPAALGVARGAVGMAQIDGALGRERPVVSATELARLRAMVERASSRPGLLPDEEARLQLAMSSIDIVLLDLEGYGDGGGEASEVPPFEPPRVERRVVRRPASVDGGERTGGEVWAVPVDNPRITSRYGPRVHPVTGQRGKMHRGTDFGAPKGTPVRASASGVVVVAGWCGAGPGNCVVLEHPGGWRSQYFHLSSWSVRSGARVGQGDEIGAIGSTGRSTGPHLHFQLGPKGEAVDPERYFGEPVGR